MPIRWFQRSAREEGAEGGRGPELPRFEVLDEEADLDRVLSLPRAIVYKHSTRCSTSSFALREMRMFSAERSDLPVFLVDVHAGRPLSNLIESHTGVRHESPQALYFEDGAVRWSGSHSEVTRRNLADVLGDPGAALVE